MAQGSGDSQASTLHKGPTLRQVTTVGAVMLGSYLANFDGRLISAGLADLKGGFSLSFDEGAWFSTATIGAQIFIAPMVAWLFTGIGLRRVFAIPSLIFAGPAGVGKRLTTCPLFHRQAGPDSRYRRAPDRCGTGLSSPTQAPGAGHVRRLRALG